MGGPSVEYDISIISGKSVCDNLNKDRYEVIPVFITRGGEWLIPIEELIDKIDLAFLALHGEYGEDGTLQRFLDDIGIPYTGSSAKTSALGMNKSASSKLFKAAGLFVPDLVEISKHSDWARFKSPFGYPVVVKPIDKGSSIGVSVVRNEFDLQNALCRVFEISRHAMIQQYISGREVTCGVIEDDYNIALPPTEVFPFQADFFDYNAKYLFGASKITPALTINKEREAIQKIALTAHSIIGAEGFSRADMIIGNDGKIYILEVNTLPGLRHDSLFVEAASQMGFSYPLLLDKIIAAAIRKFKIYQ